ncbi:MAG: hypothetical protein NTZ33_04045 [Bacteroidetes bacterium]|nr:hypothetical protein [Bacteroidota bacterium]
MQIKSFRRLFLISCIITTLNYSSFAQCCGGGNGSPIAGGSSQGVLQENQFEVNTSFQFINTSKSYTGSIQDTVSAYNYRSSYNYTRFGYGVTKNLTISLEAGYWFNKTEDEIAKKITFTSNGIGDLIIFPKYNVFLLEKNHKRTEITVGLGFKIPLGKYNDSTAMIEPFSHQKYYIPDPIAVQSSTGSHDLIFYTLISRFYSFYNFRTFANILYVKKGWNPLGEKMGDYLSVGLFAGKTFFEKLGVTLQLKAEWIAKMQLNKDVALYGIQSYDPLATGSKKLIFAPQLSYSYNGFVVYVITELPLYQYVTKTQIASQYQTTLGVSYRFKLAKKPFVINPEIEKEIK